MERGARHFNELARASTTSGTGCRYPNPLNPNRIPNQRSPKPVSEGIVMPKKLKAPERAKTPPTRDRGSLKIRGAYAWLNRGASLVALRERDKVPIEKGWRADAPIGHC